MSGDLPSTAALRAFVHAARSPSFKAAAEAVHLSPSALSRQIQGLEEQLGVALFTRTKPGLALTEAGVRYLATAERVLRDLQEAGRALRPGRGGPLRVSALESFSANWLVPRLPEFHAAHPEVEIELEATLRYADFSRDAVDVAIRFGVGPWDDLHAEPLVDLSFFPVCSPGLRDAEPSLRQPVDLARHTWIHVSQVPDAWSDWARAVGQAGLAGARDLRFDHVDIALSAAASGQGVALSAPLLCAGHVADGRLCIPFDLPVRSRATYHLVCRPPSLDDPRVVALRDWLVDALS